MARTAKLAEAAARRAAAAAEDEAHDDDAGESNDGDDEQPADEIEEDEVDDVEAARAQGPEAMFNVGVAKVWRASARRDIARGRALLLGAHRRASRASIFQRNAAAQTW